MTEIENSELIKTQFFLDGQWRDSESGNTFPVINPYNQEVIARVPDCGQAETVKAIEAAERAFPSWRHRTALDRVSLIRKWRQLILDNLEDLARIITLEQGKPLAESRGEVSYGASFLEWFAEESLRVYGDTIPSSQTNQRILVLKQPVGVVAAITPWNFPIAMITRKLGPALGVGCTVIVKPAEDMPLTALAVCHLAEVAGFPPGVINLITSNQPEAVGDALTDSTVVRKISFTGSTAVGKILMGKSAGTLKRLSLELGGNAPFIVLDDADLDKAVDGAIASKYRNAGQTCVCANRIFAQSAIYSRFRTMLVDKVRQLKVGSGLEEVDIGPLINQEALQKVKSLIADATAKGAVVEAGGFAHPLGGTFFQPTVLSGITMDMNINREEIFGPIAPVYRFESDEEAIQLANDTRSGLAAYFYGKDMSRIWRMAEGLEYGMVGINTGMISNPATPFGGVKESGFGREGSKYGIDEYLDLKYVCLEI